MSSPTKAAHTYEIPYLFKGFNGSSGKDTNLNAFQKPLADQMIAIWTNVKNLNDIDPQWQPYEAAKQNLLSFRLPASQAEQGEFAARHQCEFWQKAGLGFATARQLARQGYHVILTVRKTEQAEARTQELRAEGSDASPLQLDIADADSVRRAVEFTEQAHGKLNVLINNAAIMAVTPVMDFRTDLDFVRNQFDTNLLDTWCMAQEFFPLLKAAQGKIINVSSSAGSYWESGFGPVNNPGLEMRQFGEDVPIGSYSLTKLAINGLMLKLAQDFKSAGIAVNAVCPGLVETYPSSPGRSPEEGAKSIVRAATLPDNSITGGFFRDGKRLPW